jgi:hypothetical protein
MSRSSENSVQKAGGKASEKESTNGNAHAAVDDHPSAIASTIFRVQGRMASCWNAAKLLGPDSSELMEKTIPDWQWLTCPQYPQIGTVF